MVYLYKIIKIPGEHGAALLVNKMWTNYSLLQSSLF